MARKLDTRQQDELHAFVEALAEAGGFTSTSEWARESGYDRSALSDLRRRWMMLCRTATSVALVALAAAGRAQASPVLWTPTKMTAALVAKSYPAGAIGGHCTGTTKPVAGRYAAFRCSINWQIAGPPTQSGTARVFAMALSGGRVCASRTRLAACTVVTGALPGDPTVCSLNDPRACVVSAGQLALAQKVYVNAKCVLVSLSSDSAVVTCSGGDATSGSLHATVTFTRGPSAWTTAITQQ